MRVSMRGSRRLAVALVSASAALVSSVWAAPTYTVVDLGADISYSPEPESSLEYVALNNNNYALVMRQDSASTDPYVVIQNLNDSGRPETLIGTAPGTTRSIATAFNDSLQVVGYTETAAADGTYNWYRHRAFLYSDGVFIDLSTLLPPSAQEGGSTAVAINNRGDVIGRWQDANLNYHGFLYSNGTMTELSQDLSYPVAINNLGEIVTKGDINDLGQKVYTKPLMPGAPHSTIWCYLNNAGVETMIGKINNGAYETCGGLKINSVGIVVGDFFGATAPTDPNGAWIYIENTTLPLAAQVNPADPTYRNIYLASAKINDRGLIVAYGNSGSTYTWNATHYYLLTPVAAASTPPSAPVGDSPPVSTPPAANPTAVTTPDAPLPTALTPPPTSAATTAPSVISPASTSSSPTAVESAAPPTAAATDPTPSPTPSTSTSTPMASTNSGSSGGGAMDWLLLTLISAGLLRRRVLR